MPPYRPNLCAENAHDSVMLRCWTVGESQSQHFAVVADRHQSIRNLKIKIASHADLHPAYASKLGLWSIRPGVSLSTEDMGKNVKEIRNLSEVEWVKPVSAYGTVTEEFGPGTELHCVIQLPPEGSESLLVLSQVPL